MRVILLVVAPLIMVAVIPSIGLGQPSLSESRGILAAVTRALSIAEGGVVPFDACYLARVFGDSALELLRRRNHRIQESLPRSPGDTACAIASGLPVRVVLSVELSSDSAKVTTQLLTGVGRVTELFVLVRRDIDWGLVERRQYQFYELH